MYYIPKAWLYVVKNENLKKIMKCDIPIRLMNLISSLHFLISYYRWEVHFLYVHYRNPTKLLMFWITERMPLKWKASVFKCQFSVLKAFHFPYCTKNKVQQMCSFHKLVWLSMHLIVLAANGIRNDQSNQSNRILWKQLNFSMMIAK